MLSPRVRCLGLTGGGGLRLGEGIELLYNDGQIKLRVSASLRTVLRSCRQKSVTVNCEAGGM